MWISSYEPINFIASQLANVFHLQFLTLSLSDLTFRVQAILDGIDNIYKHTKVHCR